ncbi:MAG: 6-phospho-3-hexuloisomerase [Methanomicrobiales archaeon]|nr:6-phospho-3-hexuloisomerase [Methanomicrobiales archaeon]MDI6876323.1 6-phospho-3-hexuloisomerase [Methanomicrobiales archaeon]
MITHRVQDTMRLMASLIRSFADSISDDEVDAFVDELMKANRIFVMGAGRSGLVAKAFAMRLMHLGFQSFVVGETITPALRPGDVMVVFSSSGETKTVADLAETAKGIGGRICLITSRRDSRIGRISDCIVTIESHRDRDLEESGEYEIRQMLGEHKSFAPLGTLFETASMVFADAVISRLMEITKTEPSAMKARHATLE